MLDVCNVKQTKLGIVFFLARALETTTSASPSPVVTINSPAATATGMAGSISEAKGVAEGATVAE